MRIVLQNPWVRAGGLAGGVVLLFLLASMLSSVLVPLFFAFIVAYAFDPLIDIFERWRVPRMLAIVGFVLILIAAGLSLPLVIVPSLVTEAQRLATSAAEGLQGDSLDRALAPLEKMLVAVEKKQAESAIVDETPERKYVRELMQLQEASRLPRDPALAKLPPLPTTPLPSASLPPDVASPTDPMPPAKQEKPESVRARLLRQIGQFVEENAASFIASNFGEIAGAGQQVGSRAAGVVSSVLSWIFASAVLVGNIALFIFMTVYLLNDYDHIIHVCDGMVPPRYRHSLRRFMRRVDAQLRAFFRGQGMVCLCLGTMYGIGLLASDAPFAVPLAIFGGLVSFVPYLGLALTIGPAALLTVLVHGLDWHVLGVLATFAIANFLEGNFITPAVVGKQVGLAPVWVILAIMVFGSTLGFLGLLLAVPAAAVLKVVIEELVAYYRASEFFGADVSPEGDAVVVSVESVPGSEPDTDAPVPRKKRK